MPWGTSQHVTAASTVKYVGWLHRSVCSVARLLPLLFGA